MAPKVFKERGPNPLSVMAIFHPFLKIKRKKSPLHNFTVLIPTHLQTSLTLKSEATGQESSARPTYPHRTGSEREPVLTVTFYQSVQFSHQSSLTLCTPKDCSTPRFPVHHQLQELTQTHVHWVGGAIQPFHPLSSPSPTFNLCHYHSLFQWVSSSHQVARVLEFQLQHQSFQWIFRTDFL